jgi:hypothetical protein
MSKYSESIRTSLANSLATLLNGFAVSFFNGTVPSLPSDAVTGTLLATFTVNGDGVTGGTWATAVAGVVTNNLLESLSATCLVDGSPTFYRIHNIAESASSQSNSFNREQGTIGLANTDCLLNPSFFPMTQGTSYPLGSVISSIPIGI